MSTFREFSFKSDLFNVSHNKRGREIVYKIVKIRCDNKNMRGAKKKRKCNEDEFEFKLLAVKSHSVRFRKNVPLNYESLTDSFEASV